MAEKGENTRARILDEAMRLASQDGVKGLSIGILAGVLGMSKSGLFAHFGSKEALQIATLERRRPDPGTDGPRGAGGARTGAAALPVPGHAGLDR